MQYVQSSLENELDFCRHRTGGLWDEYRALLGPNARLKRSPLQHGSGVTGGRRAKIRAAASYDADAGSSNANAKAGGYGESSGHSTAVGGSSASSSSSCSCGVGSAGPPGSPGFLIIKIKQLTN